MTYVEQYGIACMTLAPEEFDEVFSLVFSDCDPHFELFSVREGAVWEKAAASAADAAAPSVNVFEVFCALYLLSSEELRGMDAKIASIFKLFDFDASGKLDSVELEVLVQACVKGIARATGTKLPLLVNPTELAARFFSDALGVKPGERGEATLDELKGWVSAQAEIVEYLGAFTSARLIAQEQRNVEAALGAAIAEFTRQARGNPPEMDVESLAALVRGLDGSPPRDEEIRVFLEALDQNAGAIDGKVHLDEFEAAILPWIAFSTIDLDRSASLSKDELKVLLWISDGIDTKEPSKQAIDKAISEMDVDKNGTIDRLEWVMYCSGYDAQTGAMKFSRSVRDLWRAIDLDGSHTVAIDEIRKEFIKELDAFMARHEADGARPFKPASREILNKLVHEAAADLRDEMDMNSDHIIEWNEFKKHQRGVAEKIDGVKKYASQIYAQDGAAEQAVQAVEGPEGRASLRVVPR